MEQLLPIIEIFFNIEILILWQNLTLKEKQGFLNITAIGMRTLWFLPLHLMRPYTIQINYILKTLGLSSTNTTTYLSQKFPNGLLYACLVEAYGFLKGPVDMLQLYDKKYTEAVKGFSIEQMGRRRRDEYQAGVPRIGKQ